jgi:hypothetical protein
MLLLHADEASWPTMTQAQKEQGYAAYMAYADALVKAGALKASGRLQPTSTAATVRVVDGKPQVLDGPYADSKEQLGGYFLIDVADADAAMTWAARCPGASHGAIEVRPLWAMPASPAERKGE